MSMILSSAQPILSEKDVVLTEEGRVREWEQKGKGRRKRDKNVGREK